MNPDFWGPSTWKTMHSFAANIALCDGMPNNNQRINEFVRFVGGLKVLLPCEECRLNYIQNLKILQINSYTKSGYTLFLWTVHLHNMVNREKGKKAFPVKKAFENYGLNYVGDNPKPKSKNNGNRTVISAKR